MRPSHASVPLEMNQDLFAYIPSEIIIEILSKLPVGSIISCKCVCKSWLALLESREFVKSHLLKSIPGLAVFRFRSKLYKLFEFDDGLHLEHHQLHYKPFTEFNIPGCKGCISGTANGLLFLRNWDHVRDHDTLHICNPITRDYIQLDASEFVDAGPDVEVTHGFGSSKITGQHKVVRISQDYVMTATEESYYVPKSECLCHVYTIGTGLWRRKPVVAPFVYDYHYAEFLNGNLHWLVSEFEGYKRWISCFDLETEVFSTFSSPIESRYTGGLTIFRDCLCLCDDSSADGFSILLMKEYGVEKSWTKQFFVSNDWRIVPDWLYGDNSVYLIKIFKDGDILLAWQHYLLHYCKKYNYVQKLEMFGRRNDIHAILYTPSFLSLKSFRIEKVISF